jgi:hypothetical protein
MYKVIKYFTDLQDHGYKYAEGDTYPRKGYEPSAKRIEMLSTKKNRRKTVLIEAVPEETAEAEPKEKPRKKKGRGKNADSDMSEN